MEQQQQAAAGAAGAAAGKTASLAEWKAGASKMTTAAAGEHVAKTAPKAAKAATAPKKSKPKPSARDKPWEERSMEERFGSTPRLVNSNKQLLDVLRYLEAHQARGVISWAEIVEKGIPPWCGPGPPCAWAAARRRAARLVRMPCMCQHASGGSNRAARDPLRTSLSRALSRVRSHAHARAAACAVVRARTRHRYDTAEGGELYNALSHNARVVASPGGFAYHSEHGIADKASLLAHIRGHPEGVRSNEIRDGYE